MMQEMNYIRCGDYYIPDIRLADNSNLALNTSQK